MHLQFVLIYTVQLFMVFNVIIRVEYSYSGLLHILKFDLFGAYSDEAFVWFYFSFRQNGATSMNEI